MKKYRVILPPVVQELIRRQALYIAKDSIDNALKWEARLRAAINDLAIVLTRNPIDAGASDRLGEPVRKLVFERTYLIFYRIREASRTVDVLNFRHGAQLPPPDEP